MNPSGEAKRLAWRDRQFRPVPVGPAHLDHPVAVVENRRDVHGSAPTVRTAPIDSCRKRGGGVHNHEVTRLQQVRQVMEPSVLDQLRAGDEESDAVTCHAAALGWRGGIAAERQCESGGRGDLVHCHGATVRSAAR